MLRNARTYFLSQFLVKWTLFDHGSAFEGHLFCSSIYQRETHQADSWQTHSLCISARYMIALPKSSLTNLSVLFSFVFFVFFIPVP